MRALFYCFSLGLTAALALITEASASPRHDVSLAVLHEDNLPRAERRQDRLADTAIELAGRMSRPLLETERSTLLAELGLGARWWTEHPDLSEFSPALGLRYRHRLGPDFTAPWLEVAGTARGIKTADSVIRDGVETRLGLTLGQRLNAALDARMGYSWQLRRAEKTAVFDTANHEVFAQLDWHASERWLVYTGLTARVGDLVTVSSVPNPKALRHAEAITPGFDFAFDRSKRRAYRIDGHALMPELGVNYRLGEGWSLDLAGTGLVANARGDNRYHQFGITASLLWQF